jgi:hypothetical protein
MAGRDGGMVVAMRESALYIVSWRVVQRAGIRVGSSHIVIVGCGRHDGRIMRVKA